MGGKSQKTSSEPWKDIQPFLLDTAQTGADLFAKGNLAPDNVGLGDVTRQGLSDIAGLARNNPITAAATGGLGDLMGAPRFQAEPGIQYGNVAGPESYGGIAQNAGIDAVRGNVLDSTLPAVASMFGQGGFVNSTTAQDVAGRAVGSALAPYEYDQYNRNRQLDLNQFNTEQDRELGFNTQQHAAKLNQLNVNADRRTQREGLQSQEQLSALGLAPSINSLQYGDAQSLLGVGQVRDENRLANASNKSNEVQAAAQLFSQLGGLGQSGKSTPSTLDSIGGLGQAASSAALAFSLFCDRRVKRDIMRVGTWRGVALYTFRYLWDDVLRIGPMAQEVPDRARIKIGDFYAVDLRAI